MFSAFQLTDNTDRSPVDSLFQTLHDVVQYSERHAIGVPRPQSNKCLAAACLLNETCGETNVNLAVKWEMQMKYLKELETALSDRTGSGFRVDPLHSFYSCVLSTFLGMGQVDITQWVKEWPEILVIDVSSDWMMDCLWGSSSWPNILRRSTRILQTCFINLLGGRRVKSSLLPMEERLSPNMLTRPWPNGLLSKTLLDCDQKQNASSFSFVHDHIHKESAYLRHQEAMKST